MSHQNNANKLILSDFHSPQTQEDCNSLCHQQSPNALGLSHVSSEGSSLGPHFRPTVVLPGPTAPLDSGEVAGVFAVCGACPWHIGQSSYTLHWLCASCQAIFPVNWIHILLIDTCSALLVGLSSQCPLLSPINIVLLCS